ncbi:MAG: hypothetical protein B7Z81_08365 [Acidocella sp. 20-61-6]|nr:MAG: hypothetical protein B7Z81_08365 [Acidocella sp. 20-61-6]
MEDSKYSAKVIGRDPKTDLALLKIDAGKPLPYVAFGDSGKEKVGDWVVAVGNPYGLGGTVTLVFENLVGAGLGDALSQSGQLGLGLLFHRSVLLPLGGIALISLLPLLAERFTRHRRMPPPPER